MGFRQPSQRRSLADDCRGSCLKELSVMANINLLPWRDELRAEKKKQFYTVLGLVAALGAVVVFGWLTTINGQIEAQRVRNNLLEREIAQLDKKVDEIKELKKEREQL